MPPLVPLFLFQIRTLPKVGEFTPNHAGGGMKETIPEVREGRSFAKAQLLGKNGEWIVVFCYDSLL